MNPSEGLSREGSYGVNTGMPQPSSDFQASWWLDDDVATAKKPVFFMSTGSGKRMVMECDNGKNRGFTLQFFQTGKKPMQVEKVGGFTRNNNEWTELHFNPGITSFQEVIEFFDEVKNVYVFNTQTTYVSSAHINFGSVTGDLEAYSAQCNMNYKQ